MALDSSHRAGQTVLPGCQDVRSCCLATGHGPKLNVWEIRAESKSDRSPTPSDRLQAPATQTPLLNYGVSPHGQPRTPWLEKEYVRAPTVFWGTHMHMVIVLPKPRYAFVIDAPRTGRGSRSRWRQGRKGIRAKVTRMVVTEKFFYLSMENH